MTDCTSWVRNKENGNKEILSLSKITNKLEPSHKTDLDFGIVLEKKTYLLLNPIALRKAKIVYNFGLSECNRVKTEL